MKVSINDVARRAEVSIKTVSRVINNEPSVRAATRQKVVSAIEELGYQPNQAARNLARSRSYTIGFVYSNPNAYYVVSMQEGIIDVCQNSGYEVMIHPLPLQEQQAVADYLENLVTRTRLAGLVLTPPFSEMPELLSNLDNRNIEYVAIQSSAPSLGGERTVRVNDRAAAKNITSHLIDQGHQQIGFLRGDPTHYATQEREAGYREALLDAHLTVDESLIYSGQYSFESGSEGVNQLLSNSKKPTAIFASNDEMAAGALFRARLTGLEIPEQLAIAGFENSPYATQTWPQLTTATLPVADIAQLATQQLLARLSKRDNELDSEVTPELIIRGSTLPA